MLLPPLPLRRSKESITLPGWPGPFFEDRAEGLCRYCFLFPSLARSGPYEGKAVTIPLAKIQAG